MFYKITVTDLQGKPLFRYAFTSLEEAEKYFQKIQDEELYSHAKLILQDAAKNEVLNAVRLPGTIAPDYPDAHQIPTNKDNPYIYTTDI
jgi:hypothetical protein